MYACTVLPGATVTVNISKKDRNQWFSWHGMERDGLIPAATMLVSAVSIPIAIHLYHGNTHNKLYTECICIVTTGKNYSKHL